MTLALFGITNDGLSLAVNLLILFLVVLWLALVAWTFLDARRRIGDPVLVACATAASLFPFVGTLVYSILRPPELLADKRERELEIRASELRVRQLEESSCPNCEHPVERTFLRCPNCRARIKDPCESCGKPIDPRWSICPYCETPQRRAAPPEQRPPSKRRGKPAPASAPPSPLPRGPRSRARRAGRARAPRAARDPERGPEPLGLQRPRERRLPAEGGSASNAGSDAKRKPATRSTGSRTRSSSPPPKSE